MNIEDRIKARIIGKDETLIQALKFMDVSGFKSLLVLDRDNLFVGILSIGDIQRAIIKGVKLDNIILEILRNNPKIAQEGESIEKIKEEMLRFRMEFMPVIDHKNQVTNIYFWDELFFEQKLPPQKTFTLPVVIMAGGTGSRLKPLTNVLPKPLIPIGEKTIIEEIFEHFAIHGCDNFYISLNYKSDLIKYYLKDLNLPYILNFYEEKIPLGTGGSLSLLRGLINETFFVSNCDILIEQDYSEILEYHRLNKNEITIVAALKHYPLAYGSIETGENGRLLKLVEKPELTFKINSGMYVLEPHLLDEIPLNKVYHITTLIEKVLGRKGNVGVFPVSEGSWIDIGDKNFFIKYLNQ